jgi:microbial collagenase
MFEFNKRQLAIAAVVLLSAPALYAQEPVNAAAAAKTPDQAQADAEAKARADAAALVLTQVHQCNSSLQLRSVALTQTQQSQNCADLAKVEQRFMRLFDNPKPVLHDGNSMLRANIYQSKQQYVQLASQHFLMPTDNGGMYLEGLPHLKGNQAEFVAYQRHNGEVWNLGHEYVHYLDGRFNLAGDFCANLHDSHAAPENCPRPAPLSPYLVWWTEGMAEYVAHGDNNPAAIKVAKDNTFLLSALFHTGYETNTGSDRVYRWGYLAVRYMFEKHPDKLKQMLAFTRSGDYPRYQALVNGWGQSMDKDFSLWLSALAPSADQQQGGK